MAVESGKSYKFNFDVYSNDSNVSSNLKTAITLLTSGTFQGNYKSFNGDSLSCFEEKDYRISTRKRTNLHGNIYRKHSVLLQCSFEIMNEIKYGISVEETTIEHLHSHPLLFHTIMKM